MAKREWLSTPKKSWPTGQIYVEEMQPRLSVIAIARIASSLGISEPYAAEVRAENTALIGGLGLFLAKPVGATLAINEAIAISTAISWTVTIDR